MKYADVLTQFGFTLTHPKGSDTLPHIVATWVAPHLWLEHGRLDLVYLTPQDGWFGTDHHDPLTRDITGDSPADLLTELTNAYDLIRLVDARWDCTMDELIELKAVEYLPREGTEIKEYRVTDHGRAMIAGAARGRQAMDRVLGNTGDPEQN